MTEAAEGQKPEKSKTKFWAGRAVSSISEMRRNKKTGLFPKKEGWRNVVEHELVEAEAADVLAEKLGLSDGDRKTLRTAILLHDVFKRKEIENARKKGASAFAEEAEKQSEWVRSQGYSQEVVELIESVAHLSLPQFQNLESVPLIKKIIHYVDDITLNDDLVLLDERIDALEADPKYKELNEEGRKVHNGKTYFEVEREVSKKIEEEFAPKLGVSEPSQIPVFIKSAIAQRIEGSKMT